VFSFAILLWEILALRPAFGGPMAPHEYRQRVVMRTERPPVRQREWPWATCQLLRESWNETPQKRPTMERVAATLRADLNALSDAPEVLNRTHHMKTRSINSLKDLSLNASFFQQEVMEFLSGGASAEKSPRADKSRKAVGSVHSSISGL
jgi:hypothetical protein